MSESQREEAASRNSNITTGVIGVPTTVDEAPEVVIYEEIYSEVGPEPLGDEVNAHDIDRNKTVMVETVDEEEEVETSVKRRYPNRKRHKTTRYEPKV